MWDGINGAFLHSEQLMFGYITVDKDTIVPEHKHHHEQWTHLLEGEFGFTINGETHILLPGMAAQISSNTLYAARENFVAMEVG